MVSKLSTKRKSDLSKHTTDVNTLLAKTKDLLNDTQTFVCTKVNDRLYKVGKFKVLHKDKVWQVSDQATGFVTNFNERVTAVAYCALMYTGKVTKAKEIMSLDSKVHQLAIDELLFRVRLSGAINDRDDWRVDLYNARYTNVKAHLATVKGELQKTLNMAKYLKLWPDQ